MSEDAFNRRFWLSLAWLRLSVGRKPLLRVERTELFVVGFGIEESW